MDSPIFVKNTKLKMIINYISEKRGKLEVRADLAFIAIYPTLSKNVRINEISSIIKSQVISEAEAQFKKKPTLGSLNNCGGRWNELAFLLSAHESILKETQDLYLVKMGNETGIKFWEIYKGAARQKIHKLLLELEAKGMSLRCSTPDFVVINKIVLERRIPEVSISQISPQQIASILELYKNLKDKCEPSDVKSFISLKLSNRPDRRYQILYEANITKYIDKHICGSARQLRFDIIGESKEQDTDVFNAPEIFTLPSELSSTDLELDFTEKAIDSNVSITTIEDLKSYWKRYH